MTNFSPFAAFAAPQRKSGQVAVSVFSDLNALVLLVTPAVIWMNLFPGASIMPVGRHVSAGTPMAPASGDWFSFVLVWYENLDEPLIYMP